MPVPMMASAGNKAGFSPGTFTDGKRIYVPAPEPVPEQSGPRLSQSQR